MSEYNGYHIDSEKYGRILLYSLVASISLGIHFNSISIGFVTIALMIWWKE